MFKINCQIKPCSRDQMLVLSFVYDLRFMIPNNWHYVFICTFMSMHLQYNTIMFY